MIGYSIILTMMQVCFISAIYQSRVNRLLSILILSVMVLIFWIVYKSEFELIVLILVKNGPYLQLMLLISSYE